MVEAEEVELWAISGLEELFPGSCIEEIIIWIRIFDIEKRCCSFGTFGYFFGIFFRTGAIHTVKI